VDAISSGDAGAGSSGSEAGPTCDPQTHPHIQCMNSKVEGGRVAEIEEEGIEG